jgi:hypothetical protein
MLQCSSDHRRRCEKKFLNRVYLEALRRSIKGGSGESVAALRAMGRRDLRRLRGRMMKATIPAKMAKRTTTTTDAASVVISGAPQMSLDFIRFCAPSRECDPGQRPASAGMPPP